MGSNENAYVITCTRCYIPGFVEGEVGGALIESQIKQAGGVY